MSTIHVEPFYDPRTFTLTFVVHDPASKDAVVIDPVLDFDPHGGGTWTESVDRVSAYVRDHVRLIDVREPHEYVGELGHIAGAALVPLATVAAAATAWDRDADIILICRSGARSGRAAEALVTAGFRRVMNMAGGMLAYNAAQLPVERP